MVDNTKKLLPPAHLLALDFVGCVLLGIGLAKQFGQVDVIPASLRFEDYGISFIIGGVVCMIPAAAHMIKSVMQRGAGPAKL